MSSSQGIYLLDTNVFIEAAKHYYAFDLVGSFWKELVSKAEEEGCIESIDQAACLCTNFSKRPELHCNAEKSRDKNHDCGTD